MTMISESGAIVDVNEIAASLGVPVEEIHAEDAVVETASLEELLDAIENFAVCNYNDEEPIFSLAPAVESVLQVTNAIQESGSISRSDAITLQSMTSSLEDFKDAFATLPASSYTAMPSMVNFDASMESILTGVGRKLLEIIKEIVKWVKEKGIQLISIIRDKRFKTAQAAQASKKVDEALEESRKQIEEFLKEVKADPNYFENKNQASKYAARVEGKPVDLKLSAIFARLSESRPRVSAVLQDVEQLISIMEIANDEVASGLLATTKILYLSLAEKPVDLGAPVRSIEGSMVALGAMVAHVRELSSQTVTISSDDPEEEISKRLSCFNEKQLMHTAHVLAMKVPKITAKANEKLKEIQEEMQKETSDGSRLGTDHPLIVAAKHQRDIMRTMTNISDLHSYILGAWSKGIAVGAALAKNPSLST